MRCNTIAHRSLRFARTGRNPAWVTTTVLSQQTTGLRYTVETLECRTRRSVGPLYVTDAALLRGATPDSLSPASRLQNLPRPGRLPDMPAAGRIAQSRVDQVLRTLTTTGSPTQTESYFSEIVTPL